MKRAKLVPFHITTHTQTHYRGWMMTVEATWRHKQMIIYHNIDWYPLISCCFREIRIVNRYISTRYIYIYACIYVPHTIVGSVDLRCFFGRWNSCTISQSLWWFMQLDFSLKKFILLSSNHGSNPAIFERFGCVTTGGDLRSHDSWGWMWLNRRVGPLKSVFGDQLTSIFLLPVSLKLTASLPLKSWWFPIYGISLLFQGI